MPSSRQARQQGRPRRTALAVAARSISSVSCSPRTVTRRRGALLPVAEAAASRAEEDDLLREVRRALWRPGACKANMGRSVQPPRSWHHAGGPAGEPRRRPLSGAGLRRLGAGAAAARPRVGCRPQGAGAARPASSPADVRGSSAAPRKAGSGSSRARPILRRGSSSFAWYWYQQAALHLEGDGAACWRVETRLCDIAVLLSPRDHLPGQYTFVRRFEGHQGNVTGVAFRPDGQRLLTCGGDRTVRLWDVETGRQRRRVGTHADWCAAWRSRRTAATACRSATTTRCALDAGGGPRKPRRFKGHTEWVAVAVPPSCRTAAWCPAATTAPGPVVGRRDRRRGPPF